MKRANPPCSSITLLLWSSPPCTMLLPLTTVSAVALDVLTLPPANQGATVLPNGVFGDRNTPRLTTCFRQTCRHHSKSPPTARPADCSGLSL